MNTEDFDNCKYCGKKIEVGEQYCSDEHDKEHQKWIKDCESNKLNK